MNRTHIKTKADIDAVVALMPGTWVKRRNLRVKLTTASNEAVTGLIDELRTEVRAIKASGAKQNELSGLFSKITNLELKLIEG